MPVRFNYTQGIFGWLLGNSRKLKQLILDYYFVTIKGYVDLIHFFFNIKYHVVEHKGEGMSFWRAKNFFMGKNLQSTVSYQGKLCMIYDSCIVVCCFKLR